jgi:hypothetical protein
LPNIPFEFPASAQDEDPFWRINADSVMLAHVIAIGLFIKILFVNPRLRYVAADLRAEAFSIDGAHHSLTLERRQFEFDNVGEAIGTSREEIGNNRRTTGLGLPRTHTEKIVVPLEKPFAK